ncbi:MAG: hypothetical protein CVU05_07300 [Bacteroidetes bacterium HGW-Bacteroidetes-21]|nr:MAG: hypothetical protein CVU05_07300 [Bacteroidetes bacterium HGW-Bacteroidetes-21]
MGRHNGVIAYPDKYASYAVSVRQYRTLQSRCLQCLSHDKPPCDLLMLSALIVTHKGLPTFGRQGTLWKRKNTCCFAYENFICIFEFFHERTTSVRCSCRAHTAPMPNNL